jgi:hypothetical protein
MENGNPMCDSRVIVYRLSSVENRPISSSYYLKDKITN